MTLDSSRSVSRSSRMLLLLLVTSSRYSPCGMRKVRLVDHASNQILLCHCSVLFLKANKFVLGLSVAALVGDQQQVQPLRDEGSTLVDHASSQTLLCHCL